MFQIPVDHFFLAQPPLSPLQLDANRRFNCCRCSRTNLSHYWVVQQGGTSAPNPVFHVRQSIKNECPWLLLAVGGRTQLQKKGFAQFPNCTRNLLSLPLLVVVVHRFCTIFRAHPHILKRSRFSPRCEFERWSQYVTKTYHSMPFKIYEKF